MQLLVISGSRNHEGQTARAIKAICKGYSKAGGKTECVFLPDFKLERCRQCDIDGWGPCKRTLRCVIKDDFPALLKKIDAADVVVFANPVYFGDLTESMRTFLERLRRISFSIVPRPGGVLLNPSKRTPAFHLGIPAIGLCLSGGGGGGAPSCCPILENIMQRCGFDVVDMIPMRRQNIEFKIEILEITGKWLATKPTSGIAGHPPIREVKRVTRVTK
jgi:NAD(P)H-dependent FMN reductase